VEWQTCRVDAASSLDDSIRRIGNDLEARCDDCGGKEISLRLIIPGLFSFRFREGQTHYLLSIPLLHVIPTFPPCRSRLTNGTSKDMILLLLSSPLASSPGLVGDCIVSCSSGLALPRLDVVVRFRQLRGFADA
jgi:hypothetical protein